MWGNSSNSPSSQFLAREAAQNRACMYQLEIYNDFINGVVKKMISEFDNLKSVLEKAVTAYLNEIEHKFFRKDGYKRALTLNKNIIEANNILELVLALEEAIKTGNEDDDSLKTFLFKSINLNFCNKNHFKFYPPSFRTFSSTSFLKKLIREVKDELKPICLQTLSQTSEADKDLEINIQRMEI